MAQRLAAQPRAFYELDIAHPPQLPQPGSRKVTQVASRAAGGVRGKFEFIFEQISLSGEAERPAVVLRAPDNHQRGLRLESGSAEPKPGKGVTEKLPEPFDPVSHDSHAPLEFRVERMDHHAVSSGARHAHEIAARFGRIERHGQPQRDAPRCAPANQPGGPGDVPWDAQLFGEHVGGSRRQYCQRNLATGQAVDDLIHGAIASADHDELAPLLDGTPRQRGGLAARRGGLQFRLDAGTRQDAARRIELPGARPSTAPGKRVMDHDCVLDSNQHPNFGLCGAGGPAPLRRGSHCIIRGHL